LRQLKLPGLNCRTDLVVYTGDNVTNVAPRQQPGWDALLEVPIARALPHAIILGNHDDEYDWTRAQIIACVSPKPHSLTRHGPAHLAGAGNYYLKILPSAKAATAATTAASAAETSENDRPAAILWFMDSLAYRHDAKGKRNGYASVTREQIDWYRQTSAALTRANHGAPHPALLFLHTPLHEFDYIVDTRNRRHFAPVRPWVGICQEPAGAGPINTGLFAAMHDAGDVIGVFCGHNHYNNYIGVFEEIVLAYGRWSGDDQATTYKRIGAKIEGGANIIVLKENARAFTTHTRLHTGGIIHQARYPDSFALPKKKKQPHQLYIP
jgi:hypothetical protein